MFYFLLPFLLVVFILLVLGLIQPKIIQKIISVKFSRVQIALVFGLLTAGFFVLTYFASPDLKTWIKGDNKTIKQIQGQSQSSADRQPEVKRSVNGVCHAKGTKYYELTTNFKSFSSMETCLRGGGRMPKK